MVCGFTRMAAIKAAFAALVATVSFAGGVAAQHQLKPSFHEVLRVGGGSGAVEFGRIRAMAFSPSGDTIVVLDGHAVVVLDSAGNELDRWGQQGEGPGEFEAPMSLAVSRESTVAVADRSRVGVFSLSGELIRSYRVSRRGAPVRVLFDPYAEPVVLLYDPLQGSSSVVRLSDDSVIWTADRAIRIAGQLFAARPLMADLKNGQLVAGLGDRYSLSVVDVDSATTVRELGRDLAPRVISSSFESRVRGYLADPQSAPPGWTSIVGTRQEGLPEPLLNRVRFPATFPVVTDVFPGPPNSLWVQRGIGLGDDLAAPVEPPDYHAVSFDLFDEGTYEYQGTVTVPDGFIPLAGTREMVAGIETGLIPAIRVVRLRF